MKPQPSSWKWPHSATASTHFLRGTLSWHLQNALKNSFTRIRILVKSLPDWQYNVCNNVLRQRKYANLGCDNMSRMSHTEFRTTKALPTYLQLIYCAAWARACDCTCRMWNCAHVYKLRTKYDFICLAHLAGCKNTLVWECENTFTLICFRTLGSGFSVTEWDSRKCNNIF